MQLSQIHLHRRLDELALEALGPPPPLPVARPSESEVSIEVIWEAEPDIDELAVTGRFVRFSAPYERVEIEHVPSLAEIKRVRPTTFVKTVRAAAVHASATVRMPAVAPPSVTVPFDRVWFEQDADADDAPAEPARWLRLVRSWTWLFISLAVAGAAVTYVTSYAG